MRPALTPRLLEASTRAIASLVSAAIAAWQLAPFWRLAPEAAARAGLLRDDAYFYAVLAEHHARYGFFTFDGEMSTNGFQPLWMIALMLAHAVTRLPALVLLLRGTAVAYVAFAGAAAAFAHRASPGSWAGKSTAAGIVAGLVLLNVRFEAAVVTGLETPLMLLVVVALLWVVDRLAEAPPRTASWSGRARLAGAGLLAGACFLARTDLFWLPAVVAAGWLLRTRDLRAAALLAGGAAVVAAPYVAWNLATQGALMPISGRVKLWLMATTYPTSDAYWGSEEWRGMFTLFQTWLPATQWAWLVGLVLLLLAGTALACLSPRTRARVPPSLQVLAAAALLHAATMQLGYRELRPYTDYYFAPEVLFVALALGAWVSRVRPAAVAPLFLAPLALSSASWRAPEPQPRRNGYWEARVDVIHQLQRLAAGGGRAGAFWPGAVAALTGMPVTPLDGIAGSAAYFRDWVVPGKEIDYALEHGVRWVFVYARPAALTGPTPPSIGGWVDLGVRRLWERRDRLRIALSEGGWTIVELLPAGKP